MKYESYGFCSAPQRQALNQRPDLFLIQTENVEPRLMQCFRFTWRERIKHQHMLRTHSLWYCHCLYTHLTYLNIPSICADMQCTICAHDCSCSYWTISFSACPSSPWPSMIKEQARASKRFCTDLIGKWGLKGSTNINSVPRSTTNSRKVSLPSPDSVWTMNNLHQPYSVQPEFATLNSSMHIIKPKWSELRLQLCKAYGILQPVPGDQWPDPCSLTTSRIYWNYQ